MVDVKTKKNIVDYNFSDCFAVELAVANEQFAFGQKTIEIAIEVAENTFEAGLVALGSQEIIYIIECSDG